MFIGNHRPDDLKGIPRPWFDNPHHDGGRFGPYGEIMPQEEFYGWMKMSDQFDLMLLESDFVARIRDLMAHHPLIREEDLDLLGDGEPIAKIAKALADGADVILAGRASETSLFAAYPMSRNPTNPGICWHMAKILECGAACVVQRKRPDSVFAWVRDDHFVVEPLDPDSRCTPQSVASHTLYENADPFLITEPSGVIVTTDAVYEAETDRAVGVSGARFTPPQPHSIQPERPAFVAP